MYNFHLSKEAEVDISRIYEYGLNRFGLNQANKYYIDLFNCIDKICKNPTLFPIAIEYINIDRYCVCGIETIYYNFKNDIVEIVTIIGRQDY